MPIVLGGGIGGLSAAFYLARRRGTKQNIRIFESASRLGGWVRTGTSTNDRNVRFEAGPRTLRPAGPRGVNTLLMCSELGLDNEIVGIPRSHPAARNRMILVDNQLHQLPSSLLSMFKTTPPFRKPLIAALLHDYKHPYAGEKLEDDSIYNFAARRLGEDVAKYLVSSMICGICAGDAKEISVKFLLEKYFDYEQNFGSVSQGILNNMFASEESTGIAPKCSLVETAQEQKWSIYSMRNGLETLPDALQQYLQSNEVEINLSSKCDQISFDSNSALLSINGKEHVSRELVSSLPAFVLGELVQKQHPLLAEELLAIPYVDVAVVNLHFEGNLLRSPGFGFLVPPSEDRPILGVIYDSSCFDMGPNTVLTVMMGGKWFAERFGPNVSEEHLLDVATTQVQSILKIDQSPVECKVNVLRKCIPQYVVGHRARIRRIQGYIKDKQLPIALCGSAVDGVGVNDVIFSAKSAVEGMIQKA